MRLIQQSKNRRRGQVMLMFTLMLPVIMGMIGLAIDRTILFIVEAKLGAATDGAALGAGRLLGTVANTEDIATTFLAANFPAGYWGSYAYTPYAHAVDLLTTHTITVSASVKVPLLFMRIYGAGYNTIYATAQATRRDSRIVVVLDRSGSMTPEIADLKAAAVQFTGMFSGTDELGLVVFGSSAIVAYPTTNPPYDASPTGAGGPDSNFSANMPNMINAIQAGGDTGMAEALSMAYIELQKGHNRDLKANGTDDRLNAIVLFTDGMPTSLAVNLNPLAGSSIDASNASKCKYKSTNVAANQMIGWIGTLMYTTKPGGLSAGLYGLASDDSHNTTLWWMSNANGDFSAISPATPITNCVNLKAQGQTTDLADLANYPAYDLYNNSTTNNAYTQSWYYQQSRQTYDPTDTASSTTSWYNLDIACWNATDNAGATIRSQTAMNQVAIYTIGYTGNGGVDTALLQRLANTKDSSSYNPAQPTGIYTQVTQASDLLPAFNAVASAILRLAQ